MAREHDNYFRVFVSSDSRGINPQANTDRCELRWSTSIIVNVVKRIDDWDADNEQPGTYEAIDEVTENAEYIAMWMGDNRQIGNGFGLQELDQPQIGDDEWLRQSSVYLSRITASYG